MNRLNWTISILVTALVAAVAVLMFWFVLDGLMTVIANWGMR